MNRKEFKHLDALRGIMATYVSLVHFYILFKLNKNNEFVFENLGYMSFVQLGQVFMTVFFVLSGFLITYILLIEKEKTNSINFRKFYLRRAFRILPMYYLTTFIMYLLYRKACVQPNMFATPMCTELTERTMYYVFMVPNWAHAIDKTLPHISNFWSIGAEEQFYIIWPLILFLSIYYLRTFFSIYILYSTIIIAMILLKYQYFDNNETFIQIAKLIDYTRFGAFAFGGIFAYYLLHHRELKYEKVHQFITKKWVQFTCLILPFIINTIPIDFVIFVKHVFIIPCCGVIIYNLAFDENSILKLDNKFLNYLGKITYSLYILNQIVIDFMIKICFAAHIQNPYKIFVVTMIVLLVFSVICYEFIEKPFMKWRRYFG